MRWTDETQSGYRGTTSTASVLVAYTQIQRKTAFTFVFASNEGSTWTQVDHRTTPITRGYSLTFRIIWVT